MWAILDSFFPSSLSHPFFFFGGGGGTGPPGQAELYLHMWDGLALLHFLAHLSVGITPGRHHI